MLAISESEGLLDGVDHVEFLPGEELYGVGAVAPIGRLEFLGDGDRLTAYVAISGCLAIDGIAQFQALLYLVGCHGEEFGYLG